MSKIIYIDKAEVKNKTVLLRVDFNVSLDSNHGISDDARIKQSIPTIKLLLKNKNKIIIVSHLGRPKGIDKKFSLGIIIPRLKQYFPGYKIALSPTLEAAK